MCPVRIDLHGQLLAWRREVRTAGIGERVGTKLASAVMERPALYRGAGRARLWSLFGRRFPGNPAEPWLRGRELPQHPGESFREQWLRERGEDA